MQEKSFLLLYKITFLRKKQNSLKGKFLLVAKRCTQSFVCIYSVLVLQKVCFPKYGFFSFKKSVKKIDIACL